MENHSVFTTSIEGARSMYELCEKTRREQDERRNNSQQMLDLSPCLCDQVFESQFGTIHYGRCNACNCRHHNINVKVLGLWVAALKSNKYKQIKKGYEYLIYDEMTKTYSALGVLWKLHAKKFWPNEKKNSWAYKSPGNVEVKKIEFHQELDYRNDGEFLPVDVEWWSNLRQENKMTYNHGPLKFAKQLYNKQKETTFRQFAKYLQNLNNETRN